MKQRRNMALPRPEYPRPQCARSEWINLNGTWTFTFDPGESGLAQNFQKSKGFSRRIIVPFCPESKLSGVQHTDFIKCMWYHRKIRVPREWKNRRIILHFGAVDFESEVFIDGKPVGRHFGGTVSFSHDITRFVTHGHEHDLVVYVRDDLRAAVQPSGKQCPNYNSEGCMYTRTTGIWQTVWMEPVSEFGIKDFQLVPDLDASRFVIIPRYRAVKRGLNVRAILRSGQTVVSNTETPALSGGSVELAIKSPRAWSPESPFLYDLELQVYDANGVVLDKIKSYAGLRKVHVEGNRIFLNNEPRYLRLVLDQGFYPDGIWTAPNDHALKHDIELSMKAGFNGARLHQKVFEERFHYWADKLGYLTWGECSSWGCDINSELAARNFLTEWAEIVVRDRNHPSIIVWTPHNESVSNADLKQHNRFHIDAYELSRMLDPTRPVNDTSGYIHARVDLWTIHDYTQDPKKLKKELTPSKETGVLRNYPLKEPPYEGQPYIVDEFGGIKWIPESRRAWAPNSWGYGDAPKTLKEFYARLDGQIEALHSHKHICGYCYTQLTDVEQEQNGVYNYDRTSKFDMTKIASSFGRDPKWWKTHR